MAAPLGLVAMPTRPSAAWREAFLLAAARPFLRSSWAAFSANRIEEKIKNSRQRREK